MPPDLTTSLPAHLPPSSKIEESRGDLTLGHALELAVTQSPELTQYSYDIRSAEARSLQASYRPNPDISLLSEDFGGSRTHRGFRDSQTTLAISQLIELGGKRSSRQRLASLNAGLAAWDYETKRLDVFIETTRSFIDVLAAQRRLELAEETLALERQFYNSVSERSKVGDASLLEERRAQVTLSNTDILIEQARRDLATARIKLASHWGEKQPVFTRVEGSLESDIAPPPPLSALEGYLGQNPEIARWSTEISQREAQLAVERSKNVPDATIQGGPRRYGDNDTAFIAGVSISLPVFGMNQGNILDALAQLAKSRTQQQVAEIKAQSSLRADYEQLSGLYQNIKTLRRVAVPAAETAYAGVSAGYRQGKFGLVDVLDARRSLLEARSNLIRAEASYHTTVAELERLTGQPLRVSSTPSKEY